MVKRYAHTLIVTTAGEATQDAKGNLVPGVATSAQYACRYETNTKSLMVRAQDGTQVVYEGVVYTKASGPIALGSGVEVRDEAGAVIATGTVKQVVKSSFNTKVWL